MWAAAAFIIWVIFPRWLKRWLILLRKPSTWYGVLMACALLVVGAVVFYSQIRNRPYDVAVYSTNDPYDNQHDGVLYTCGCSLPSTVEKGPKIPTTLPNPGLDVCYEKSHLIDAHVLMYNANSEAAEILQPSIRSASLETVNRMKTGYRVKQEAHELSGDLVEDLHVKLPQLYLNGYKPHDALRTVPYLQSDNFTSFPTSFLRLGFIYVCNNCNETKNCSVSSVNQLLKDVAQGEPWGYCYEWGGSQCSSGVRYMAKCTFFPPAAIPFNFAVQSFLEKFFRLPDIGLIYSLPEFPIPTSSGILNSTSNSVSFQATIPYVNFSHVVTEIIPLSFVVLEKNSALWFSLLDRFSTLEKDCSSLHPVEVCNGTSLCNVFTTGGNTGTNSPTAAVRNYDAYVKNSTTCEELLMNETFDNDYSVWEEWPDEWWEDYSNRSEAALCMEHSCSEPAPYLVTWNMSQNEYILNDSLNQFLYSTILKAFWAQRSGVCTNNYYNVFQDSPHISNETRFFQASCTNRDNIFCWLTGNYSYLNDPPPSDNGTFARRLPDGEFRGPAKRFVCFKNSKQPFWIWIASTLGILFGWMGTVALVLHFTKWLVTRTEKNIHQYRRSRPPGSLQPRTPRTTRITRKVRTVWTARRTSCCCKNVSHP